MAETQTNDSLTGTPLNNITDIYNSFEFNVNGYPRTAMAGSDTVPVLQGLVGALDIPANTLSGNSTSHGVAGYARTESAVPAVGVYGCGLVKANNTNAWGSNFTAGNVASHPLTSGNGFDGCNIYGMEIDLVVRAKAGGVAPGGNAYGSYMVTASNIAPTGDFNAYHVASVDTAPWNVAYNSQTGAAQVGLDLWPVQTGSSKASQPIYLRGSNSSAAIKTYKMQADLSGNLHLTPPDSTSGTYIENSAGTTRLQVTNSNVEMFGTVKVNGVDIEDFNPAGAWTSFTPSLGGYSSQPTTTGCRYKRIGNTVTVNYDCLLGGTSNNSFLTCTLPIASASNSSYVRDIPARVRDNGNVVNAWGLIEFDTGATEFTVYKDALGASWTSSGGKGFRATFTYECAT